MFQEEAGKTMENNILNTDISFGCYRCGKSDRTLYPIVITEKQVEKTVNMCTKCTVEHDREVEIQIERQIKKDRVKRFREESNVPLIFKNVSIKDFLIPKPGDEFKPSEVKKIREAYDRVLKFMESVLSRDHQVIAFLGNVGTGKSLLASAMVNSVITKLGERAQFLHAGKLSKNMMDNFEYSEILNDISRNSLTVIDDINSASISIFTRKAMSDIINEIYINKKSLIITGNMTAKELQEDYIGARGYDRIMESHSGGIVPFRWQSFRGISL